MNAHQAERFRSLMMWACEEHIKKGSRIISYGYAFPHLHSNSQDPFRSLFLGDDEDYIRMIRSVLGSTTFSAQEYWAFQSAFNGRAAWEDEKQFVSAILIGKELADKYLWRNDERRTGS